MYSSLKALYPLMNERHLRARRADFSGATEPPGRTRGSLRIILDARRARQANPAG
jgi:hypothetical protein